MLFRKKLFLSDVIIRVLFFLYSLIIILPMIWILYTSFKTPREFLHAPWALPERLVWENYYNAWFSANIGNYFLNSVIVTSGMVVLTLLLASMASYTVSRYKFIGSSAAATYFMAGLLVPKVFVTVPLFQLLLSMNLLNTHIGLILAYTGMALPFSVFVLIGFFQNLPKDLESAAMVDGASHYRIFFSIMLPLARPGLVTVSIFNFLWYWNEYPTALTVLQRESLKTLPLGLVILTETQERAAEWGQLFAGIIIVMIPVVVIYILFQRMLISGLNTGAVKE